MSAPDALLGRRSYSISPTGRGLGWVCSWSEYPPPTPYQPTLPRGGHRAPIAILLLTEVTLAFSFPNEPALESPACLIRLDPIPLTEVLFLDDKLAMRLLQLDRIRHLAASKLLHL